MAAALGRVDVPQIGPRIRLTAAVAGDSANLTVTDGAQTFSTSSVLLENNSSGLVGLWHYQVGDMQQFRIVFHRPISSAGRVKAQRRARVLARKPESSTQPPCLGLNSRSEPLPTRQASSPKDLILVLEGRFMSPPGAGG